MKFAPNRSGYGWWGLNFCCQEWALATSDPHWFWPRGQEARKWKVGALDQLHGCWSGVWQKDGLHHWASHPAVAFLSKNGCGCSHVPKQGCWPPLLCQVPSLLFWLQFFFDHSSIHWIENSLLKVSLFRSRFAIFKVFSFDMSVWNKLSTMEVPRKEEIEEEMESEVKKREGTLAGFTLLNLFPDFLCWTCSLLLVDHWIILNPLMLHLWEFFLPSHWSSWWGASADEQEPDESATHTSADAILRDYRYKLQCMYMEPSRDLRVAVSKMFEPSHVVLCLLNVFIVWKLFLNVFIFCPFRFGQSPSSSSLEQCMEHGRALLLAWWLPAKTGRTTLRSLRCGKAE